MKRFLAGAALLALAACSKPGTYTKPILHRDVPTLNVVTTFSTLNSFVDAVGGVRVHVQSLVPIGASPEDYQPTPQDVGTLSQAQLLVENGAGIEAWLQRSIGNVRNTQLHVAVMTQGIPLKNGNPHAWMDPVLAKHYVSTVRDALITLDPQHREYYFRNARAYDSKLDRLRAEIQRQVDTIPPQQRAMIVFHNAWQYYNDRFGIRTIGVIELSPGQDPNPQYIAQLIDLAKKNHVRAVFAEPEYSPKLVNALAKSAGIKTVENLYDDSIGEDKRVSNYIDMLRYDTHVIVQALK
ncbi:MAG: metal ABC transporter substrate-binding protein [Vulcanimicrobiaceae bacterium]